MKDQISLTVPFEYNALTRASDFLHGLAQDARIAGVSYDGPECDDLDADRSHIEAKIPASQGGTLADGPECEQEGPTGIYERGFADGEKTARHVAAGSGSVAEFKERAVGMAPEIAAPYGPQDQRDPAAAFGPGATSAPTATAPATAPNAGGITADATAAERPAPVTGATGPAFDSGLDIDADGLPWDGRIHSSSKKKLSKTEQWKKRRKPNDQTEQQFGQYVASVEAELLRVMQAGPHAPVEPNQDKPEPSVPSAPTGPTGPTPPPAVAAETSEIKTLPELFRLITDNFISDSVVVAAINAQGITSLPLLGARPDLIPAVAKALQGG
jgi:hypothetical protein